MKRAESSQSINLAELNQGKLEVADLLVLCPTEADIRFVYNLIQERLLTKAKRLADGRIFLDYTSVRVLFQVSWHLTRSQIRSVLIVMRKLGYLQFCRRGIVLISREAVG